MRLFYFLFILLFSLSLKGQCPPPGTINLSSQTQVNEFAATYGNCNVITGDLIIISGFIWNDLTIYM